MKGMIVMAVLLAGCSAGSRAERRDGPPASRRAGPPATIGAQPVPSPSASSRVTIDAAGKDLREVVDAIARASGVNIVVDQGIDEKVTLRLVDVDWRDAIDALARETRTRIVEEEGRAIRLTRPPSIRMELHDADVRAALLAIAAQAGVSIVIPEEVQGKVSLSLVDVPWMDALEAVAASSGHVLVRGRTSDP